MRFNYKEYFSIKVIVLQKSPITKNPIKPPSPAANPG